MNPGHWLEEFATALLRAGLPAGLAVHDVAETLRRLARRLADGPGAPARIAYFGPTGVGKSKLFNTLFGQEFSPSGYRRPWTMQAAYLTHESHADLTRNTDANWLLHSEDRWRDVIFIDTPDFDSIESTNRLEAEKVLREADAFLFVTDVHKYGDLSTWEYLGRVLDTEKPLAVVLNKVAGPAPVEDFFSRLESEFTGRVPESHRIVIRHHAIDDHMCIPGSDPGVDAFASAVAEFVATSQRRQELVVESVRSELRLFEKSWSSAEKRLGDCLEGFTVVRGEVEEAFTHQCNTLHAEVDAEVDPAVKAEVFAGVLASLEKIDPLRYPRKLLALPVEGVKALWKQWFPTAEQVSVDENQRTEADETFQLVEARVLALTQLIQEAYANEERCAERLSGNACESLKLTHAETLSRFRDQEKKFCEWLRHEVEVTASTLTGENKVKFFVAQMLYNSAIIGVQISTGGGLMMGEVLANAVLSPLMAKAIGLAVSSERVTKFETDARDERHRLHCEVLATVRDRALDQLQQLSAWAQPYGQLRESARELVRSADQVCAAFADDVLEEVSLRTLSALAAAKEE